MNRSLICILLMLTVAPVCASLTVVCLDPSRWGGSMDPVTILSMALFGLFTIPIWPTYIPALILVPIVMNNVAGKQYFKTSRLSLLLGISFLTGAVAGAFVMLPLILLSHKIPNVAMNWAIAGAVSGSITLGAIVLVLRRKTDAQSNAF